MQGLGQPSTQEYQDKKTKETSVREKRGPYSCGCIHILRALYVYFKQLKKDSKANLYITSQHQI